MLAAVLAATVATDAPASVRGVSTTRYASDGWIITVQNDAFSGERRCTLHTRDRNIVYQPAALGFHVRSRDTLNAVYRIDDGAPVRWADRYPALMASGVEIDGPALDNPTGGIVWVPQSEVTGARIVHIRAAAHQRIRRYSVASAASTIAETERLGCVIQAGYRN